MPCGSSTAAKACARPATAGQSAGARALNPMTGMRVAERSDIDVVFLDIRMPGLDGLELARVLNAMADPPPVVFVTAHDDRAVDAYEVGAVDYLLKPLRSERLSGALDRTIAHRAAPAPAPTAMSTAAAEAPGAAPARRPAVDQQTDDEVIPVELAGTTKIIPRSSIRFVEAQGDYARLHTTEGSHLVGSRSRCSRTGGARPGSSASTGPTSWPCT